MSKKNQDLGNVPALRFKGFEGEWEKKKLSEVTEKINSGKTPLGGESVYTKKGITFIRSQNVTDDKLDLTNITFISEEINNGMKNSIVKSNDVLLNITGASLGRSCVVPNEFNIGNVNQHVCIIRLNSETNPRFVQPIFSSSKGQNIFQSLQTGSGREGLNFESIKNIEILFPSLPEQTKIASFLSAVDEKLQALKKKKSLLEDYKKGVMQKIFSQELRFKDEKGKKYPDWEEKKLGEVTFKVDKKNKEKETLPIYSISNVKGFVPQSEQFEGMDSNERGYDISLYKIVEKNTFAYNPARINVGSIGYSGDLNKVIVSSLYVCFKTKEYINDNFFNYFLKTNHFNNSVLMKGEGGVRIYLFYENFSQISISFPSLLEQSKIAEFLCSLDDKINSTKAVIEKTETWKKGLLQRMFV